MKILWALIICLGMVVGTLGQGFSLRDGGFAGTVRPYRPGPPDWASYAVWTFTVTAETNNAPVVIRFYGFGDLSFDTDSTHVSASFTTGAYRDLTNIFSLAGNYLCRVQVSYYTSTTNYALIFGPGPAGGAHRLNRGLTRFWTVATTF